MIPGITAVQALAARHRIPLNRIAEPVLLTTGRKLAEGFPPGIDSVVVLLDGEDTYRRFADQDMEIYWGAYLGTPDEILIAGKLADVADEIHRRRAEARQANGWIMDTYSDATAGQTFLVLPPLADSAKGGFRSEARRA